MVAEIEKFRINEYRSKGGLVAEVINLGKKIIVDNRTVTFESLKGLKQVRDYPDGTVQVSIKRGSGTFTPSITINGEVFFYDTKSGIEMFLKGVGTSVTLDHQKWIGPEKKGVDNFWYKVTKTG